MEGTRVTLLGSLIDLINSFRKKTEETGNKILSATSEKILKEYGDERLLKKPEAVIAFEKAFNRKGETKEFVTKVKTSNSANGGAVKDVPIIEAEEQIIEGKDIEGRG